jgi:hypothetical protein
MKATFTALAALLVSTITLNAASAQTPYPVTPAMNGAQGGYYAGPTPYAGPVDGVPTSGGCDSCGKHPLLDKLGLHAQGGCKSCGGGCGDGKCGSALCAALKGWLCRPYPSNAPICRRAEYPLGFKTHPYARSPRDYFMFDDP